MAEVEIWRGGVEAWECDAMGHLNVGFYVAKAMEGLAGLAAELGMPHAFAEHATATLLIRDQHIRFLREAHAGAALTMTGGVLEMGESDARLAMVLRHASGDICASVQMVVEHATARDGCVFPWPERLRARGETLLTTVLSEAAPRSVTIAPVEITASWARAEALGLRRTGLGVVRSQDCDVFGRMRPETFMARISAGISHLFEAGRPGDGDGRRLGGAVLEYRLTYLAWPRAGERIALRSGLSGGDAKVRRLVHWLLDPATGQAWASAEAIAVSFDLDARKIVTLSDAELARMQGQVVDGLAL